MIVLTLPLPNSANTHWRHGRGITYLSKEGRAYRDTVKTLLPNSKPTLDRLEVSIDIYPRDKRAIDLDNRIKPLLDALEHANVFENDSQIDRLIVSRKEIYKGGKCTVTIRGLNDTSKTS